MLSYRSCTLCPRQCGVDREAGELGFCRMPGQLRAARAMLHYGEEPPICANYGTGAVFFSGCTLRCRYCQNGVISTGGAGETLTPEALRETFLRLIDEGAQSIDLVTPTHFLPSILPALTPRLPVPVIYNCGGYESVETLRELEGLIDIYLPDYKYADPELAARLSGRAGLPSRRGGGPARDVPAGRRDGAERGRTDEEGNACAAPCAARGIFRTRWPRSTPSRRCSRRGTFPFRS